VKNFQPISTFDPVPVLNEIMRQPDLWAADTYLSDYQGGPFAETETIFLRFPRAARSEQERANGDEHECVWMDGAIHLPSARPLIFALMSKVQGERLGRVMITKLRPGARIYPHADTPSHAQYWDRYHLVIKSGPGCNFRCGDEVIHMPPCSVWWFQNIHEHEVTNNSADDRIHMIVDIRTSRITAAGLLPTSAKPVLVEAAA